MGFFDDLVDLAKEAKKLQDEIAGQFADSEVGGALRETRELLSETVSGVVGDLTSIKDDAVETATILKDGATDTIDSVKNGAHDAAHAVSEKTSHVGQDITSGVKRIVVRDTDAGE